MKTINIKQTTTVNLDLFILVPPLVIPVTVKKICDELVSFLGKHRKNCIAYQ